MIGNFDIKSIKLENIYRAYLNLDSRQQTIALVAAGVVLFLAITLPLAAARSRITSLRNQITKSRSQISDVLRAVDTYQVAKQKLGQSEKILSEGFDSTISTTLETLAAKNNMAGKIDSLKEKPPVPSELLEEVGVDVRLKNVPLSDAVSFLYDIENQPDKLLRLKTLQIKPRFGNQKELDVVFQVSTYRLAAETR